MFKTNDLPISHNISAGLTRTTASYLKASQQAPVLLISKSYLFDGPLPTLHRKPNCVWKLAVQNMFKSKMGAIIVEERFEWELKIGRLLLLTSQIWPRHVMNVMKNNKARGICWNVLLFVKHITCERQEGQCSISYKTTMLQLWCTSRLVCSPFFFFCQPFCLCSHAQPRGMLF